MILGIAGLLLFQGALSLGAFALLRRWELREDLNFVAFLCLRLVLATSFLILAGVTRLLHPIPLAALSLLVLVALLLRGEHRHWRIFPWGLGSCPRWVVAIAGFLILRWAAQVWFFVPHQGDALAYHLPKVAEWIQAQGFVREMGAHSHVTFPAGFEMIECGWALFLRHDVLIEAAGGEFLLLGFAALRSIALQLGLKSSFAHLAGLILLLSPGFYHGGLACLNDTPVAALVLTSFALAMSGAGWVPLVLVGGLGLGVKATFAFALPGVLLLAGRSLRTSSTAPTLYTAAALGLAAGAFWYVRNLLWYANPFFPMGEAEVYNPTPVQFGPSLDALWGNLRDFVHVRVSDRVAPYSANADHQAGWGIVAFSIGSLAALAWAAVSSPFRKLLGASLLSLVSVFFLTQNDEWSSKYAFFFSAIPAVAAAWATQELSTSRVIVGAGLLFNFAATFFAYDLPFRDVRVLAGQAVSERSAAVFPFARMDGRLPEGDVAYAGGPLGATYLLYKPDFSRKVLYLDRLSQEEWVSKLTAAGISDLYAPRPGPQQRTTLEALRQARQLQQESAAWWRLSN